MTYIPPKKAVELTAGSHSLALDHALEASLSPPLRPRLDREPAAAQDNLEVSVSTVGQPEPPGVAHREPDRRL